MSGISLLEAVVVVVAAVETLDEANRLAGGAWQAPPPLHLFEVSPHWRERGECWGVLGGGGAALSTIGEVTTFRFLLLLVSTPPATAATAAAAEGKVKVA